MSCLGDALRGLGHLRPERSAWEESLHCKELSLQEYGPTRDAHVWALVLGELGLTRCLIAARNADRAEARQGADECRTALAALPPAEMSLLRMMIRVRAAEAFLLAGGTTGEHSAWTEAAQCLEAARAEPAAADRGVWFTRIEALAERTRAAQAGISRSVPGAQHTQPS